MEKFLSTDRNCYECSILLSGGGCVLKRDGWQMTSTDCVDGAAGSRTKGMVISQDGAVHRSGRAEGMMKAREDMTPENQNKKRCLR
jgi:hypothetical protein